MLCNKCNNEMVYFKRGQSCGWTCPKCGSGIVTSYVDEIQMDTTIYTLTLKPSNNACADDYKVVAKLCNSPILEAKKKTESGCILARGLATKIKECIKKLDGTSLSYEISPDFPYQN